MFFKMIKMVNCVHNGLFFDCSFKCIILNGFFPLRIDLSWGIREFENSVHRKFGASGKRSLSGFVSKNSNCRSDFRRFVRWTLSSCRHGRIRSTCTPWCQNGKSGWRYCCSHLFLFQSFPFKSTHFSLKKNFGEGFFNYVNYRFFSG